MSNSSDLRSRNDEIVEEGEASRNDEGGNETGKESIDSGCRFDELRDPREWAGPIWMSDSREVREMRDGLGEGIGETGVEDWASRWRTLKKVF